jgi:hypothetical protein
MALCQLPTKVPGGCHRNSSPCGGVAEVGQGLVITPLRVSSSRRRWERIR